ncbi:MAG TPA: high-potential iron-sulfur protein [Nevskiaceae bacterium]|nr:high-potential iron-sulfur protein [Nevskiaceae bacterium]
MSPSRREFLRLCGIGALSALPLRVAAQAPAKLDPKDPLAVSLAYVENAATLNPAKEPLFKAGSNCANCILYQKAQEKGGYAPCGAVGGKLVAGPGWCKAWAKGA